MFIQVIKISTINKYVTNWKSLGDYDIYIFAEVTWIFTFLCGSRFRLLALLDHINPSRDLSKSTSEPDHLDEIESEHGFWMRWQGNQM
jgi:hypothetical protein